MESETFQDQINFEICEYPDSGKLLIAPSFEIFRKEDIKGYVEGEEKIVEIWDTLQNEKK